MIPFRQLLVLTMLSTALKAEEPQVIARAGKAEVSVDEVRASLETLDARQLATVRQDPVLLEQVVRSFIVQRLVLRQALEAKWDETPEAVARLQRARDSALTESYLESVSRPPAHYPDETELEKAYGQRKASLLIPRTFHLVQIFEPVPAGAGEAVRKQARTKVEAALREGTFSDIGWLTENQIQPEIRTHLPALKAQALSKPIALNDGWHVFKVIEVREARTPALDEVRAQLRLTLRQERQRENTQAWLAAFLKTNPLKLDAAALSRTLPSASQPSSAQ